MRACESACVLHLKHSILHTRHSLRGAVCGCTPFCSTPGVRHPLLHHLTAVSTPSHHCFPLHPFQQTWLASSAAPRAASLSWSCCRLLSAASASIRQICDRNACPSQSVCCISKTIAILEDNRLTAGELAGFTSACRRGVHFVSLLPGALLELLRSCLGGDKDGSEISSD